MGAAPSIVRRLSRLGRQYEPTNVGNEPTGDCNLRFEGQSFALSTTAAPDQAGASTGDAQGGMIKLLGNGVS